MKEVEIALISELLKNSRRSDRELAKAIGTSQPTVSRLIKKLEKAGVIKEYTMIPDFRKLGYELLGFTFVKLKKLSKEELDAARETARQSLKENTFGIVMLERGIGFGYDGLFVSFYKDYTDYAAHKDQLRQFRFLDVGCMETFLVSLTDKIRYRPLTFATLAQSLLTMGKKQN